MTQATSERDLKPCPFCGGPVRLEKTIDDRSWWGVVCRNTENVGGTCAIQQRPTASKEAAVERWNRRAPVAPAEPVALTCAEAEEKLIKAVINAYHTTRLREVSAETHILSKASVRQALNELLTAQPSTVTASWAGSGDYEPSRNMVEAGLETNHRHNSEANMIASFKAMMQQAEIDGLVRFAPSPVTGALVEALEWYGENARLARLIHKEGDAGRHALAEDGGKRARAALAAQKAED